MHDKLGHFISHTVSPPCRPYTSFANALYNIVLGVLCAHETNDVFLRLATEATPYHDISLGDSTLLYPLVPGRKLRFAHLCDVLSNYRRTSESSIVSLLPSF